MSADIIESSSSYSESPYDSEHQIDPNQMVSHQIFTRIVAPTIGSVLGTILFFSQYPSFRSMQASNSPGSTNILPLLMLHTNCILWVAYGFILSAYALIPINILGVLITLLYFFIYYSVASPKQRKVFEIIFFADNTFAMCWIGFVTYALPALNVKQMVPLGIVANIYNIAFFAAPLTTIYTVIKEKSTSSLSFPLTVMSFACACFWGVFGIGHHDPFIYVPNAIGVIFGGMQVALFAVYRKSAVKASPSTGELNPTPYGVQVDDDDFDATLGVVGVVPPPPPPTKSLPQQSV